MDVNAMAGGVEWSNAEKSKCAGGIFRQVRAALSVIPYSCVDAINALRMSLRNVAGYKNVCLS